MDNKTTENAGEKGRNKRPGGNISAPEIGRNQCESSVFRQETNNCQKSSYRDQLKKILFEEDLIYLFIYL